MFVLLQDCHLKARHENSTDNIAKLTKLSHNKHAMIKKLYSRLQDISKTEIKGLLLYNHRHITKLQHLSKVNYHITICFFAGDFLKKKQFIIVAIM